MKLNFLEVKLATFIVILTYNYNVYILKKLSITQPFFQNKKLLYVMYGIITAKEVMFSGEFVCLSVCLWTK